MSETAILNEHPRWNDEIQDNPCPDYGFTRKKPQTRASVKPPFGRQITREVQNGGYTFSLSWLNRSYACVQRVKQFAERFEDGYFTIIDHDGGGRHYVGRFTGACDPIQGANDSYDLRDLTFEEVPGVPMLKYPSDWERDAKDLRAFNDSGDQDSSTYGTWATAAAHGYKLQVNAGTMDEFLAMEYRGYGFQLYLLTGASYGLAEISLDGVVIRTVDCYSARADAVVNVLSHAAVPHDIHRVKVRAVSGKNSASTATTIAFAKLRVMR